MMSFPSFGRIVSKTFNKASPVFSLSESPEPLRQSHISERLSIPSWISSAISAVGSFISSAASTIGAAISGFATHSKNLHFLMTYLKPNNFYTLSLYMMSPNQ